LYFAILAVETVNNLPGVTLACNKVMKKNTINTFNILGIDFALKKNLSLGFLKSMTSQVHIKESETTYRRLNTVWLKFLSSCFFVCPLFHHIAML